MKVVFIYYFLIMVAGTAGELCMARTMKTIGEIKQIHPVAILSTALRAMRVGWAWLGILLMTVAFFALLGMLSMENVSLVVPATALSYGVGALGGKLFLGERVTLARWVGVSLVCFGVALVFIGRAA